jgi:pimeloyl-ACP methyl ester carboxylesterase
MAAKEVFQGGKMKRSLAILAVVASVFAGLPSRSLAQAGGPVLQQVQVSVARARFNGATGDVFVRYILIDPGNADPDPRRDGFAPLEREAVLVLFIGGDGAMDFRAGQLNAGSPNTVARNRNHFAAEGFVVAVVDAANDFNNSGIGLRNRRLGAAHLADLKAVMVDLRTKYPNLPVWAVGHSRGTLSAAVMATMPVQVTPTGAVIGPADGLVLLSSLTGDPATPSEDLSRIADLESIRAPALIVSHLGDSCAFTKPEDSRALRERFIASERATFRPFEGGSTPISDPCDPLAPHGFFGIDQKVVDAITKWIGRREDPSND